MVVGAKISSKILQAYHTWEGSGILKSLMQNQPKLDVFLAGGVIRDIILKRKHDPSDFDFFLSGENIEEALSFLKRYGTLTQGPFGSPRWISPRSSFYSDIVPIHKFYNGLWHCEDIFDVLNQFDFTGNAVAIDLRTGEIYDPINGFRDLKRGIMRAVRFDYPDEPIAPKQSITRPAVVWFRILHYASLLELTIENTTLRWIKKHKHYLSQAHEFQRVFFNLHPSALEGISL